MTSLRRQFAIALAAAWLLMPRAAAFADEASDQYAVAAGHYAARRWELAAEEFQAFLTRFSEHAKKTKAQFFCAEALVQCGKFDEAQSHFAAVIADEKSRPTEGAEAAATYARQALFRAGECAFWANQPEQAQASLSEFRQRYADDRLNAYVLHYLGELALLAGDAAAAKRFYRDGLSRYPDGPTVSDCRLGLAQAHLKLDESREAEEILAPLLKQADHAVAANYWLGQIYKSRQQWERAATAFQTALAADPEHRGVATLRYHTAESLLRAERFQAAIDILLRRNDRAGETHSLPATHAYLVALAQQGLGQHDDALATLDGLVDTADEVANGKVDLAKASSLLALRRHREAIAPLKKYLAARGEAVIEDRSRAQAQLALCHARVQEFDAAQAALDQLKATEADRELASTTTLQLAEIAVEAGQTARANAWLQAAAGEASPTDVAAGALLALGRMAIAAGDLEKGISHFERLLERFPDAPQAVEGALACAQTRERLEQYDAALAMYQLVVERHPGAERLPEALYRAANTCDRLAQDTQALELYVRLIREFPDSEFVPASIYGSAWCCQDLGRESESYEKFVELRQRFPDCEYWLDATYRLALSAAQSKNFDRATELLDELIGKADRGPAGARTTVASDNANVPSSDGGRAKTESASTSPEVAKPPVSAQLIPHGLYLRAQIAITRRLWDAARRDLDRLALEYSASPLALPAEFLRADVAYRRGDYEEAGERFAELMPKIKGRSDPWAPIVSLRRAQVLGQEKRWSEARAVAAKIADEFPQFDQQYEADYLIGRALTAEASLDEARQWYEKVVRSTVGGKTETAAMAQWMIGETYFLQEQYAPAIREYLRVEVLYAYPHWQAAALLQAGKCYEQTGQWKNAGDAYSRLLARYSQTEFADEARQRLPVVQSRTASRARRP